MDASNYQIVSRSALISPLARQLNVNRQEDQSIGVLVVEIFRFRELNNTYGYRAGDAIVEQAHQRLTQILRTADSLARVGSGEFVLVLGGLKNANISELAANKVLGVLNEPFNVDGESMQVTVYVGIAASYAGAPNAEALLQQADFALGRAKSTNTPYAFFELVNEGDGIHAVVLENELKDAINNDQLVMNYQPKVNLRNNIVDGAEALVRWHHPRRGIIFPGTFVPVAENSNLVLPFTVWTVNTVLRQFDVFSQGGLDISVAINISAKVFHNSDIVDTVSHAVNLWNAHPSRVVIEVTESAMMINPRYSLKTLEALNALGIKISIDDFGTGYSSLAYLRKLPVDELKIDRSFVQDMVKNKEDEMIVRTVIDMAHNFGLTVTAEGVEDEATLVRLAELNCDRAQGYFISKPAPQKDFVNWALKSRWHGQ